MQYSVFVSDLDSIEVIDMKSEIGSIINHAVDSIAIVDLGRPHERGRRCFEFMGPSPRLPTRGPVII